MVVFRESLAVNRYVTVCLVYRDSHATSKDVSAAVRTYEEMLASGLAADNKTLSNMVIAHSWRSTKDMTRSALALSLIHI